MALGIEYRIILINRGLLCRPSLEPIPTASNNHIQSNMSDQQKPSAKAIPEWQREKPSDSATNPGEAHQEGFNEPVNGNPGSRAALIEQASQFLEDPTTKPATTERKIRFLESKGLTNHEIFEMMGIARKEDALAKPESEDETEKVVPYILSIYCRHQC